MAPLLDTLTKRKRRESAGSDTAARFDFQKNWALCEMLKRHDAGIEYLVAFEFHDDVLFFAPESTPTSVDFIQVKTSKSPKARTVGSLTSSSSGGSILARLAANTRLVGPPIAIRLILVSNTPFEFSDVGIAGSAIAEPHRAKLIKGLANEFPGAEEETLQKLHFLIANLPVDEMDTFVKGKAVELFEKRFGINFTQNAMSWLRLIQGEIRRKNNYPDDKIATVKDLLDNKCIGRTLIEETLNDVEKQHRPPPDLSAIRSELQNGGWTLPWLIKFDKAVARAVADKNDPSNTECQRLVDAIAAYFASVDIESTALSALLDALYVDLLNGKKLPPPYQNKPFVCALGALIYHEKL